MATNIDPRSVFPSYELLAPSDPDAQGDAADNVVAAVQATATPTLVDGTVSLAVDNPGTFYANAPKITIDAPGAGNVAQVNSSATATFTGIPANGKKLTIDGTDIIFGDHTFTGANVVTDIQAIPVVPATSASATITIAGAYSIDDITQGTVIRLENFASTAVDFTAAAATAGTDFDSDGKDAATTATNLVTAINSHSDFSATQAASGGNIVITVELATGGVAAGQRILLNPTGAGQAANVSKTNFSGGSDIVAAGSASDDVASLTANYINSSVADFSASAAGSVVTIESTISNGTDPAGSVAGDSKTLSTDAAVISLSGATLESGTIETRAATAEVVLNTDADAALRGTVASITVTDAGSGYAAAPAVVIEAPAANVIDQIAKAGAQATVGSNTFSYSKEYIAIALEDIIVGSGVNAQSLTSAEAAKTSGDMRKVAYHIVRQYFDYLTQQNSIESLTISTGGTGYQVGDTIVVSGGTEQLTFTISEIDNGSGSGVGSVTEIQFGGLVYSGTHSNPPVGRGFTTATYNVNSGYNGTGCVLVINLTDNQPSAFSMSRSAITENVATGILTRTYSASFDFDETGLEVVDES